MNNYVWRAMNAEDERKEGGKEERSRVRNRGVKVREFAIVFPFTLSSPGRAEE